MINSEEQGNLYEGKPPGTPNDGGLRPCCRAVHEAEHEVVKWAAWVMDAYDADTDDPMGEAINLRVGFDKLRAAFVTLRSFSDG